MASAMAQQLSEATMSTDGAAKRDVEAAPKWDPELVREAVAALKVALPLTSLGISLAADENGCLSLKGKVQWRYQSARAEEVVRAVAGAREVRNFIVISG